MDRTVIPSIQNVAVYHSGETEIEGRGVGGGEGG